MRWYKSLYSKLAITLILVLFLIGLSYSLFGIFILKQQSLSQHQKLNRNLAENLIRYRNLVDGDQIDPAALKQTFNEYMEINPGIEIYHLDLQGRILTYSAEPGVVKRSSVRLQPIYDFLENSEMYPLSGDDPRSISKVTPFSVAAIPDKSHVQSYLYVILKNPIFDNSGVDLKESYFKLGGGVLAGSLVLGLLAGLIVFNRSTLRLKSLQQQVTRLAAGEFKEQFVPSDKNKAFSDEIDVLEHHIAEMSNTISHQWSALTQQDKLRREMVANISHDLRTPLASLQGYLETLVLKYQSLSDEQRNKYLAITLRQSIRLRQLIDDLFELAKLDNPVTVPAFEAFSINELLYDVADKLSIPCKRKNIKISVEIPEENIMVYADISMIERVLDNLIRNALRYTKYNGCIKLTTQVNEKQLVEVAVHDTGMGIAPEQQRLIFNRFYQADNPQRGGNTAGLGLAISNKIIELHRQNIWVRSQLGQGSSFYFTLQAA